MNDNRIRLAEAMGWEQVAYPEGILWISPHGEHGVLFNPFADANDDYAVLEWLRANYDPISVLWDVGAWDYTVGDYARAALKVLG